MRRNRGPMSGEIEAQCQEKYRPNVSRNIGPMSGEIEAQCQEK